MFSKSIGVLKYARSSWQSAQDPPIPISPYGLSALAFCQKGWGEGEMACPLQEGEGGCLVIGGGVGGRGEGEEERGRRERGRRPDAACQLQASLLNLSCMP